MTESIKKKTDGVSPSEALRHIAVASWILTLIFLFK